MKWPIMKETRRAALTANTVFSPADPLMAWLDLQGAAAKVFFDRWKTMVSRPSCDRCQQNLPQVVRRNKSGKRLLCWRCFVLEVEDDVYRTCQKLELFESGDRVVIGVSGGKDSSALLHSLIKINKRYSMGLELLMLAIDEGIRGYRDDSLKCVDTAQKKYQLPLLIKSYTAMYHGWTMDKVVSVIGGRQNCTYCGILRRHALEMGARELRGNKIATGHNADDAVETILMNSEPLKMVLPPMYMN
eukprot:Blabericola_migrator_1__11050@NODE_642_length_7106_cov_1724_731212_g82_i1_p3_GENE_NODE_642_length_7106_cov_1724_731212_g82_i1NODE_642_length_7106_cov_1724_731212_g82_i1_p3_ORF_typecomplete_len245_score35_57ATP_bind_3/PF01171_20/1_2e29PAPS_reduct/PF01507_19/4e05QueC/PF06508_13/0_00055tRNA_Me_trans/PF03054_16/0_012ThiI/PF02568_14/0_016NAD_synthase/PF02540_17/0_064_NODE_642_length_7106_cov_1724_731212_g82_i161766910